MHRTNQYLDYHGQPQGRRRAAELTEGTVEPSAPPEHMVVHGPPPPEEVEMALLPSRHEGFQRGQARRYESHALQHGHRPGGYAPRPRQEHPPHHASYEPPPPPPPAPPAPLPPHAHAHPIYEHPPPPPPPFEESRPVSPPQPQPQPRYEPQPPQPPQPQPTLAIEVGVEEAPPAGAYYPIYRSIEAYTGWEKCAVFCIVFFYFSIATAAVATNMLKGSVEAAFYVLLLCPGVVWLSSYGVCALADSRWSYRDPTALIFFLCLFFLVYGMVLFGVGLALPDHGEYTILKEGLTGETDLVCHDGELQIPPYDAMMPENYYILEGTWSVDWANANYVKTDDGVFATAVVSHVKTGNSHCKLVPDMTAVCQGSNRTYADECVAKATHRARDVHVRRLHASTKMTSHLEDRMRSLNVGKLFEFDSPSAVETAEWLEAARRKWKIFMGWTCAVWVTITFCALVTYFCTPCCVDDSVGGCLKGTGKCLAYCCMCLAYVL